MPSRPARSGPRSPRCRTGRSPSHAREARDGRAAADREGSVLHRRQRGSGGQQRALAGSSPKRPCRDRATSGRRSRGSARRTRRRDSGQRPPRSPVGLVPALERLEEHPLPLHGFGMRPCRMESLHRLVAHDFDGLPSPPAARRVRRGPSGPRARRAGPVRLAVVEWRQRRGGGRAARSGGTGGGLRPRRQTAPRRAPISSSPYSARISAAFFGPTPRASGSLSEGSPSAR